MAKYTKYGNTVRPLRIMDIWPPVLRTDPFSLAQSVLN